MSHTTFGLGMAALTLAGSVWYLPALVELRAGADRPVSTRIAATATVAGWATAAALALLLFLTGSWPPVAAVAVFGGTAVISLSAWARIRRKEEEREEIQRWEALEHNGRFESPARAPRSFVAGVLGGLLVAWGAAAALILAGGVQGGPGPVLALFAATVVAVGFLLVSLVHSQVIRHEHPQVGSRIPR